MRLFLCSRVAISQRLAYLIHYFYSMESSINREELFQFGNLEILARSVVEGFITGLHKSPFHGFSVEFAEHRLYNTGESTRHIDWKLYARTEKFFVKRYEEETNLRCQIVIDHSSSMYFPHDAKDRNILNKIEFAVFASASLIELFKRQRDAVGLSVFSDEIEEHLPAKLNVTHQKLVYQILDGLLQNTASEKRTSAVEALHSIADRIHRRSLIIVFSDMMDSNKDLDEFFQAMHHLKHNKHEVVLFHVVERKKEIEFDYSNRPYHFVDLETGAKVKLHPADVKENYLKYMNEFEANLKLKAGQYAIDYIEADINQGIDQILQGYLIKRAKMQKGS
tara:strand:- start:17632 stop:18639 length:1008 start_codon:yes stop_codon:yes gene_type:complete